ncbi:hypothetical protein P154DRAFT_577276 [Amniculicola lignicola CBS 123094]|uniref:Uncharacterized protein n=1 Tax=Amniculicola lignicola CBS 123094 TaxID=1392246 RepID=A0A6A5WDZ6_9PLEO|nr:hypothetical protein P154DRAFT_577276 [Amniculicola lignicola CBS 123094]
MAPGVTDIYTAPLNPIGRAYTSHERVTSHIIVLPGYEPFYSSLTSKQLYNLFPNLHTYTLRPCPNISLLPQGSMTLRGLQTVVYWHEQSLLDPNEEHEAELNVFIEVYQALAFLGNKSDSYTMVKLRDHIIDQINGGLNIADLRSIWYLRPLRYTEEFVRLMVVNLVTMMAHFAELTTRPYLQDWINRDAQFRRKIQKEVAIMNWINGDREMQWRVFKMQDELEMAQMRVQRGKKYVKMLLKVKSPVKCFRTNLESIKEEENTNKDRDIVH